VHFDLDDRRLDDFADRLVDVGQLLRAGELLAGRLNVLGGLRVLRGAQERAADRPCQ
jgi:hypothetical protein